MSNKTIYEYLGLKEGDGIHPSMVATVMYGEDEDMKAKLKAELKIKRDKLNEKPKPKWWKRIFRKG